MKSQPLILIAITIFFISGFSARNFQKEVIGQWKKAAVGQDANNNRILDDVEIMKNPEPGAYDNLHFFDNGKCKLFGMGMELKGVYEVKTIDGKKMILVTADESSGEPGDKSKSALRFEIVSTSANKLVVIPPIFSFMLVAYSKG